MEKNNSDLNKEVTTTQTAGGASKIVETKEVGNEVKETETETTTVENETQEKTESETKSATETTAVATTPTTTTKTPPALPAATTITATEVKPLELKYLDPDFIFDVLSVPTCSRSEYRMVTFIILWAREHGVKYEFDNYGNVYLTKGKIEEGEGYPCVTSHLDTVQRSQELYAQLGIPLKLKERVNTKGGHELYVEGMGIGADDKAGVLISLSLFDYCDTLKACFFLEEETGCVGSGKLNKEWFKDVAYVIGWDSPERNRAAFACSGEILFGKELFEEIEETCKEHGVTVFNSEPYTDVKEIRKQTDVVCMNFGNGGYQAHSQTEYVVMEDIDGACGLGVALIKKLGNRIFRLKSKHYWTSSKDEDIVYLDKKFNKTSYYSGYNTGNYGGTTRSYGGSSYTGSTDTARNTTSFKDEDKIDSKVLEHVIDRYEKYITDIQSKCESREEIILNGIKELCKKNNVEYSDYLNLFIENPSTDPFSTAIEF